MTAPTEPTNPSNLFSPFIQSTYEVPEDEDRRRSFLVDSLTNLSDVVNDKKIGAYVQAAENFNGNKFAYDTTKKVRNGYQALARIPAFPASGVLTLTLTSTPQYPIPNVNPQFVISALWGTASRPPSATGAGDGDFFSFLNQGNAKISFTMSDNTIVITTTVDLSAYTGFIFVEYIRDGV